MLERWFSVDFEHCSRKGTVIFLVLEPVDQTVLKICSLPLTPTQLLALVLVVLRTRRTYLDPLPEALPVSPVKDLQPQLP